LRFLLILLLAGFALSRAWPGLFAGFQLDDMMNLYGAWAQPWGKLLVANLTPFTSSYRPAGQLVYRLVFETAGLSAPAYRVLCYALLAVNVWLLYRFAAALTGSKETGVLAALIGAYHPQMADLYLNTGTLYDLLATTFLLAALISYVERRSAAWVIVFAVLAFNSKEMALTLPVLLAAYEALTKPLRQLPRRWVIWVLFVVAGIAYLAKTGDAGAFRNNPAYAMTLTWRQFFESSIHLLTETLYVPEHVITGPIIAALYAVLLIIAAMLRNRVLAFCWVFLAVTPLPVNFIPQRGAFVMYLPFVGWAIYAATVLVLLRDRIARTELATARVALFVVAAAGLWCLQRPGTDRLRIEAKRDWSSNPITRMAHDLREIHPALPHASRVLFLNDGFDTDNWTPVFVLRLMYRDRGLEVERAKMNQGIGREGTYQHVFDYREGRYVETAHR
jgi:hypothetical protein